MRRIRSSFTHKYMVLPWRLGARGRLRRACSRDQASACGAVPCSATWVGPAGLVIRSAPATLSVRHDLSVVTSHEGGGDGRDGVHGRPPVRGAGRRRPRRARLRAPGRRRLRPPPSRRGGLRRRHQRGVARRRLQRVRRRVPRRRGRRGVFYTVNVGGLENVLKAAKRTPELKKIVYTSSYFAIGPTDGCVANENQIHQGESFCTEYEKSKFLADRIALQAAAEGVPITIVYPGIMYGPGTLTSGNLVCRVLVERFNGRLPGYIGHGYDRGSFSHVDDVVKGHIAAMEKGRVGERYLLTGENASFVQIFNMAANLTNTKPPKFHIPLWLLDIYGWISVFVARITGKPPLISYPGVECLRHQWAYSCDKAKRELGYSPRSLAEGLAETLLWLKNENLIKF